MILSPFLWNLAVLAQAFITYMEHMLVALLKSLSKSLITVRIRKARTSSQGKSGLEFNP